MIMRIKSFTEISQAKDNRVPVKYNGEIIGTAYIKEYEIMIVVDRHEDTLKKAIYQQGLTGFSFEIVGDK